MKIIGDSMRKKYNASIAKEQNMIGKKIYAARTSLGLSMGALREELEEYGVKTNKDLVGRWERGETIPTSYQLLALIKILTVDGNSNWLFDETKRDINDEGLRKVFSYKNDLIASGLYSVDDIVEEIRYVDMRVSILPVSAGCGNLLDEDNFEIISVPESTIPKGADIGIRISGDSMEPVYKNGQLIWVRLTKEINPGDEGVFVYGDEGFVKVFGTRTPENPDNEFYVDTYGVFRKQPVLKSYNNNYSPIFVLPNKRFEIIGKVLR